MIFFQEHVLKIFTLSFDFSVVWLDFFQVFFISLVERKFNPIIEQRKCKGHEKRDRILVPKVEFNFHISKRIKKYTYRCSFLKLG